MRIALLDRLGLSNAGALTGCEQARRQGALEDALVEGLVAALARRDAARAPAEDRSHDAA